VTGFLGIPGPQWHAALNDFPVVLLLASVVFDLWGSAKQNETLGWAGYWCLAAGAATAVLAVVSGLLVEDSIEKTRVVDRIIETHETLGITVGVVLLGLAGWRIWRKNRLSPQERQSYTMVSVVAALAGIWLSHLGGTMVFHHAAGIPSTILQMELRERADSTGENR
jgi:uncharacterized membrane protein